MPTVALSDTLAPPKAHSRAQVHEAAHRPDIDGLRAVAILGVVLYHAGATWLPGGFAGVDVFFVISGFLISGIIFRALEREAFSFSDFYIRRIRRIFPALVLVLLGVWILSWPVLLRDEYQLLGKHIAAGAAFSVNLVLYKDVNVYFGATTTPLIHLWSLGVEEQFYILWPLLLVLLWRNKGPKLAPICILALISFALNVFSLGADQTASFYLPTSRTWELAVGAGIALLQLRRDSDQPELSTASRALRNRLVSTNSQILSGCGGLLILGAFLILQDHWAFPGYWALLPCAGSAAIIWANPLSWMNRRVLSNRFMVWVGKISYPLYLWHWPLLSLGRILKGAALNALEAAVLVAVAVALSFITYEFVEHPIRYSRNRTSSVVGVVTAAALMLIVGLLTWSHAFHARSEAYPLDAFIRASRQDWLTGRETNWTWYPREPILLGTGAHRTLFVGDSNMQQYYPRIAELYAKHADNPQGAVFDVMAGCAPSMDVIVRVMDNAFAGAACHEFLSKFRGYSLRPEVDSIVIAALWRLYLAADWDDFSRTPLRPDANAVLADLGNTISDLVHRGKRVYVVLNIPISRKFDPRRMIHRSLLAPAFVVKADSPTRAEMSGTLDTVNEKVRAVALRAGAEVIDPVDSLCNPTVCPALTASGEPRYRDHAHLKPSWVRDHVKFLDQTVLPVQGR